jgi:hypothetical protein
VLQGSGEEVNAFTQGCVLRRCAQLPSLEAILLHLLAADEHHTLPAPPLSVSNGDNSAGTAKRRNAADWGCNEADEDEEEAQVHSSGGKLGKNQQRAAKVYRCRVMAVTAVMCA